MNSEGLPGGGTSRDSGSSGDVGAHGVAGVSAGEGSSGSGRFESFSDGVMAVIITIMAFQLKTPVTADFHGLGGGSALELQGCVV